MWIALGVVAALVIGVVLWWRFRDPLRGEDFYKFHVERRWAWELILSEEQEQAFMAGLEAYDDERTVFPHRDAGVLHVYDPSMLVSLFLLAERFAALGPAALSDPAGAVRHLLDQAAQAETGGVLHLDDDWMGEPVDGMDKYDFTREMGMATHAQGVDGGVGGYGDEDSGYGMLTVLTEMPQHVRRMYDEAHSHASPGEIRNRLDVYKAVIEEPEPEFVAGLDRADGEQSRFTNTLMYDYGRVLAAYRMIRPHLPHAQPVDVMSAALARMLADGRPGITWSRPPSPEQHERAMQLISTRG
ncbi:hypothetical protein [Nonomuraea africana]|uniref:DUF2236 domain-containing protein n=1 Tax=Nonomuraea africana TaxID=46171 RepID=A0ABR9KJW9_9ACTN|nr:hypothetical protein [Nonomuraea africana]MBE1561837.1 hypothetical protein [Nonomuraea africana]